VLIQGRQSQVLKQELELSEDMTFSLEAIPSTHPNRVNDYVSFDVPTHRRFHEQNEATIPLKD
jgi:hypothetical protein